MCRLLGIVSSEPTEFRLVLRDAPRSLERLSREHRDGWGLAIFDDVGDNGPGWRLNKGVKCASECEEYQRHAVGSRGELLLAHIRKRTVGDVSLDNTHPFERDGWVFAHNGTLTDPEQMRASISPERLAQIRGTTDSELLFAVLLTHLDRAGMTHAAAGPETDRIVAEVCASLRKDRDPGAYNFLLSNGRTVYAHRYGRSLFLLHRTPDDPVRSVRGSREGTVIETPWSQRRHAVFIASEHLTDEPWVELAEGTLLRIDRSPQPSWRILEGALATAA
jgi:predicted glutamine amidotransferase